MATNFEPHEYVNFDQSTKIGNHKNKAIHKQYIVSPNFLQRISITSRVKSLTYMIQEIKNDKPFYIV